MSVWDGQREAMRLMMPVLMRKKQMEREDEQMQMQLQTAQLKLEQDRADKAEQLLREEENAQVKYEQGMLKSAYEKGDVQGVQAFGDPLAQRGMPVPAQQVAGPPGPGGLPPLQYFAAPQAGPKSFQEMAVGALPPGAGLPEIQAASQGMQRPDMSEAALQQRALAGDELAQATLDAMRASKQKVASAGATNVDVRSMGTIPPGYSVDYDEAGNPKQMVPIPGGPAAREIEAEEKKVKAGAEIKATAAQTVWEDGERALVGIEAQPDFTTGILGKTTSGIPGSPAHRVQQHIESMRGNIGIDSLLKIKESGSGLGQVPHAQLMMLASLLGKLDVEMNHEDLKYNIRRVQEIYSDIVEKEGGDPKKLYEERQERLVDKQQSFPGAPEVGVIDGGYRYKGGDPSQRRNWEKVK